MHARTQTNAHTYKQNKATNEKLSANCCPVGDPLKLLLETTVCYFQRRETPKDWSATGFQLAEVPAVRRTTCYRPSTRPDRPGRAGGGPGLVQEATRRDRPTDQGIRPGPSYRFYRYNKAARSVINCKDAGRRLTPGGGGDGDVEKHRKWVWSSPESPPPAAALPLSLPTRRAAERRTLSGITRNAQFGVWFIHLRARA